LTHLDAGALVAIQAALTAMMCASGLCALMLRRDGLWVATALAVFAAGAAGLVYSGYLAAGGLH